MRQRLLFIAGVILLICTGQAGAMDGVGPIYPTPSWDQTVNCGWPYCARFIVLTNMNREAVMDRETGLVWEQSPSSEKMEWGIAQEHCNNLEKGGRMGWRLPTLQELNSLVDRTYRGTNLLPQFHPFSNVKSDMYWSATSSAWKIGYAWYVNLGYVNVRVSSMDSELYAWCVRGGQGVDPQ